MNRRRYEDPVGDPHSIVCSSCGGPRRVVGKTIVCIPCDFVELWPLVQAKRAK